MDLLAELRGLFSAPNLSEQQALDRVRTLSTSTAAADLTAANTTIGQLRQQITDLQGRVPKQLDEEVRAERMIRVNERAEALVTQGVFSPADSKGLLTDLLGMKFDADGKPDVAASKIDDVMLARAPGVGDCRAAVILKRLSQCKPAPATGHSAEWEAAKRRNDGQQQDPGKAPVDRQAELLAEQLKGIGATK